MTRIKPRCYHRALLLVALVCMQLAVSAQTAPLQLSGIVVESNSGQPLEYATISLLGNGSNVPFTGVTSGTDGSFQLKTDSVNFYIQVSFIGFEKKTIKDLSITGNNLFLDTVFLSSNDQRLNDVLIRSEKSQTEFQLDKRVFNVGKDLSTSGASALEVLNNVPSVNVNLEGQISLRGSTGVQILINGKPSVLASEQGNMLGTITAEMIEKIEVITNPSAKYEAEGTSGIINIVIKKEERRGLNGSVTLNSGIPHNHSLGLSLNRRTEKFNLFSQIGVGYRELPTEVTNINWSKSNYELILSSGEEFRNENFYNVILGTDYHIDSFNVLTLSGNFAYEIEDQPSATNFQLTQLAYPLTQYWSRKEITEANNPKYQYELQYKRDFRDNKDHSLLFSALGNFFGKDQSSQFVNTGDINDGNQQTRTNFQESKYTFNLDYTRPFAEKWTLETGAQYVINEVSNDFEVLDSVDAEWISNPDLTNIFEYNQKVLGAYVTGAYELNRWGLKLGLRVENTDLQTLLVTTNEPNEQNFTNLFPTAHTSFKISEKVSLQAGYSRRIYRPRLWDLNPFFNIRNNFTIRTGNPDLLPEFTDSYEVVSIYLLGDLSLNLGAYYRYTTDVIERISTFEDNVNTVSPVNTGTNRTTGIELNGKYSPVNTVSFAFDVNYDFFDREAIIDSLNIDFSGQSWSSKVTSKIKLPWDTEIELTGRYQSGYQTTQGSTSDNIFADLGLRKKLLKGKAVINFSIRDVFASRVDESVALQPDFFLYSRRQRGRFITLGFSYGFGKGDAMEFSGQKRF